MAELDSLSVRVTGDSDSFERAITNAEGALSGLNPDVVETAAALQVLQNRADEAGDEIGEMAPKATTASAGLTGLSLSATGTSASFTTLATVTIVSLVPAIVSLTAALVPLTAALAGFVGIAGAIGAVGIVGVFGALKTNTEGLKSSFMAMADALGDAFAPLINAATVVLSNLMNQVEATADEFDIGIGTVLEFTDLFTRLGSAIIDVLPALFDLAITLTEEFLPPFVEFVENVAPQVPGMIRGLVNVFRRLIPLFSSFAGFLQRVGPELLEFGFTVLSVITPAFSAFGDAILNGVRRINSMDESLGRLVTAGTFVLPVLAAMATLLGGPLTLAVTGLVAGVVALQQAFQTNFLGIRDDIQRFTDLVQSVLPVARSAFEAFVSGANIPAIKDAVGGLATALDTQLSATITALEPVFEDFKTLLQDNKEEFQIIGSAVGTVVTGLIKLTTTLISVLAPGFRNVIIPILRGFIDVIDFGLTKLAEFIELAGAIKAGNLDEAISAGNQLFGGGENPELNINLPDEGAANQIQDRVEVVVSEDTELVNTRLRNEAETRAELVLQQQSDNVQQQSGTGL